jgi:predicted ATPase
VARRRHVRRFGPGPYVLGLRNARRLEDEGSRRRSGSQGYFLRAESLFNIAAFVDGSGLFAPALSLYGDVPLREQSHGQSFLALAANCFGGEGLDEGGVWPRDYDDLDAVRLMRGFLNDPERYLRAALEAE